ncbi:Uma2 family endonuclease [Candidatus Parabeggiatoa sp. HSG14]|uniref:Uma2 family endonuclease n=1 Tax=Candidatus Parabeggiatoa sp. HSG14 TaxID=3055593 RepID=UPI0025A8D07F|nr:Uma2 family endonuclease [Thiotrichales bacterium HSG14]
MATALQKYLFDIATYHQMIEANIFLPNARRVELIEGEIIKMAPMCPIHAEIISLLDKLFQSNLGELAKIRIQLPIQLGDLSEPEPDIAVVQHRRYLEKHPTAEEVFLLIEVADSSLKHDSKTKIPIYAKHGIQEVWLIDVKNTCVKVYRKPTSNGYKMIERFEAGEQITSPIRLSEISINVDDIF